MLNSNLVKIKIMWEIVELFIDKVHENILFYFLFYAMVSLLFVGVQIDFYWPFFRSPNSTNHIQHSLLLCRVCSNGTYTGCHQRLTIAQCDYYFQYFWIIHLGIKSSLSCQSIQFYFFQKIHHECLGAFVTMCE
jgi:hypothetical protein